MTGVRNEEKLKYKWYLNKLCLNLQFNCDETGILKLYGFLDQVYEISEAAMAISFQHLHQFHTLKASHNAHTGVRLVDSLQALFF